MDKNCGCGCGENEEVMDCECGHEDCDHDHEMQYINVTLDDGEEAEYGVIGTFEVDDKLYMALLSDEEEVFLYRYEEIDEETIDLINIDEDEEFERAEEAFLELFVDEE